jgi:hypothetical protein
MLFATGAQLSADHCFGNAHRKRSQTQTHSNENGHSAGNRATKTYMASNIEDVCGCRYNVQQRC